MSNISIGPGLTLLGMPEVLQYYNQEYTQKTNMVKFFLFFHEVPLFLHLKPNSQSFEETSFLFLIGQRGYFV